VVLTAVTGGLRALLLGRGDELPSDLELKALVPVSLRSVDQRGSLGNRVGGLVFPLPVGMGDPTTRLRAVVSAGRHLKASGEATASQTLLDAADVLPAPAIGAATRLLDHQRLINLVVTNVPGPDGPLYVLGARLLEAVPMVPLAGNLTLGVAVLSYCGQVTLGITADTATCPDVDVFTRGVERSLDTLLAGEDGVQVRRRTSTSSAR
jgi:WS/DGAT/MGAT family acyltransferase